MRKILTCAAMAAMIALAWSADGAVVQSKAPAKKTAARKKATAPSKTQRNGASKQRPALPHGRGSDVRRASGGKKTPARRGVTWRNRQMSPTADRYREIQGALAAKGFLPPEQATGTWNQASSDALKKFQADQNLESSGKINSLSLIALGLGPRRETATAAPKPVPPPIQ